MPHKAAKPVDPKQLEDVVGGLDLPSVFGNQGDDTVHGDGSNNRLWGGAGSDFISGSSGNDSIDGDQGSEFVGDIDSPDFDPDGHNGKGNDTLFGDEGADTIFAGRGDDLIFGGKDADVIHGGAGNDIVVWARHDGSDRLAGGNGIDRLVLTGVTLQDFMAGLQVQGTAPVLMSQADGSARLDVTNVVGFVTIGGERIQFSGFERLELRPDMSVDQIGNSILVVGTQDDDSQIGGHRDDLIVTGDGEDVLFGRAGDDTLQGGDGHDTLIGGTGADSLDGGHGDDVIRWHPGEGDDTVSGGEGHDTLVLEDAFGSYDDLIRAMTVSGGSPMVEGGMLNVRGLTGTISIQGQTISFSGLEKIQLGSYEWNMGRSEVPSDYTHAEVTPAPPPPQEHLPPVIRPPH
jgi:Ca2+-binding RTX toxin-like protein